MEPKTWMADTQSVDCRLARRQLHRFVRWLRSIIEDVSESIFDIGGDLAIAVAAVLSQPWHDPLYVEPALLEKLGRLTQGVIAARRIWPVEVVEQVSQILLRHWNRCDQLLSLLDLPRVLQGGFSRIFAHDGLTI